MLFDESGGRGSGGAGVGSVWGAVGAKWVCSRAKVERRRQGCLGGGMRMLVLAELTADSVGYRDQHLEPSG